MGLAHGRQKMLMPEIEQLLKMLERYHHSFLRISIRFDSLVLESVFSKHTTPHVNED